MSVYNGDYNPNNALSNLILRYAAYTNEEAITALKKYHFCFLNGTTLQTFYNILPAVDSTYVEPSNHKISIGTIYNTGMAFSNMSINTLDNMGRIAIFYFPEKTASSTTSLFPRWFYISFNNLAHWLQYSRVSASGISAITINKAFEELASTRIPDSLVSTETTPSTNNTINWLYE